jgi:sugar phosphate isomerase/epimerase
MGGILTFLGGIFAMRFGICNELFKEQSIEEAFRYVSSIGYNGIEVAPWTITPSVLDVVEDDLERIRVAAESARIEIIGLHWVFRLETLRYLEKLVELCYGLGGKILVFGSPNQRRILKGLSYDDAWAYAYETLGMSSFLDILEKYDVTFCLEPLSKDQTNFINHATEAIRFVKEINHPKFQMMLDGYSLTWEESKISDIIRECGPFLGHFHADDETKKGPGNGHLDYKPIAKALGDIDYDGYVSVEVHDFDLDPEETAERSIRFMKSVFI